MPLLDHFRPPLSLRRHWHSFHHAWAANLAIEWNQQLPAGYFAELQVDFAIESDVASFEQSTDVVEVQVYHSTGDPPLAGALELISPANKDRPAHRQAFVSKCEALLQLGVGLMVVDIVTEREANLHNELLFRLQGATAATLEAPLYATAYRPIRREEQPLLDLWEMPLNLGQPLPTLSLWLRGGVQLLVDLEKTYHQTCTGLKIPVPTA